MSAGLAAVATGALVLLMAALIATDFPEIQEKVFQVKVVVMEYRKPLETIINEILPRPTEPEPEPPKLEPTQFLEFEGTAVIALPPTLTVAVPNIGSGIASGTAMAIFKVAPPYPRQAIVKRIEGYVDLMFDITAAGKTENIRVTYAEPSGIFESISIKTLGKWKYKPAMENGVARPQKNETTRITYALEQ